MLNAVSTSDWHLCGGLARLFPEKALQKQMAEIEKPFQHCAENGIVHLFNPGDLTDKARMDEATFIALVTLLLKYDQHINFYYILGNHDFDHIGKTAMDVLEVFVENSAFKNVHLFRKPEVLEIDGVSVGFVPFPHKEAPKSKKPKIVFAHIEEEGAMGDNGRPLKHSESGQSLIRDPRDFVISGHLHTYQYLRARRTLFNGSLYQKNFGESLPKGFVEIKAKYVEGELQVKHQFINSKPEFELHELLIESEADWDKLQRNENMLYKVKVAHGVITPKNITREFPNIIYLNGVGFAGREVDTSAKVEFSSIPTITPLTGLVKYLMEFDIEKPEAKKAVRMVKDAMLELNII